MSRTAAPSVLRRSATPRGLGCTPAPCPEMTTVSTDRSVSRWLVEGDRRRGSTAPGRPARRVTAPGTGCSSGSRSGCRSTLVTLALRAPVAAMPPRSPGRVERQVRSVRPQPAQADAGAHLGAENSQLFHSAVGAGAQQLVGRLADSTSAASVVASTTAGPRLATAVPDVIATHRRARDCQPDGQVAGSAFIDANVQRIQ